MPSASTFAVLIVEPHADTRDMYAEFLRHHGIDVKAVTTAADALTVAPTADVVVTGIKLRGDVDGVALIARLRCDERTKDTPIAVVSAGVFSAERERAHKAGCDLFLTKPCLPDMLLRHLRRLVLRTKLRRLQRAPAKSRRKRSHGTGGTIGRISERG